MWRVRAGEEEPRRAADGGRPSSEPSGWRSRAAHTYVHWLHYLGVYMGRLGDAGAPLKPRISGEVKNHQGYISGALEGQDYLVGNTFSAADIQMSFVLEAAGPSGALESFPNLGAYL